MSTHDEARTVATLQRLAAAVPEGAWVPDEVAVRRRGRRIRARRWAAAAGGGVLVLALAVTVPAAVAGQLATPPAGESTPSPTASPTPPTSGEAPTTPAQTSPVAPPTTGTPTPVELAPGVLAAAGPVPGDGGMLTVGQFGGTLVRIARDGSDSDAMVGLSVISAEGGMGAEPRTKEALGPWATVVYSAEDMLAGTPDERWFAFGTTPPDLPGARVFYDVPDGIRQADGSTHDVLELPTFTMPTMPNNPIEAGRPWFLVGFSGDALASVRGADGTFVGHVVFAGPDGTIQDPTCGFTECTDPGTAAAYGAIRNLLLTQPAVPTVP